MPFDQALSLQPSQYGVELALGDVPDGAEARAQPPLELVAVGRSGDEGTQDGELGLAGLT